MKKTEFYNILIVFSKITPLNKTILKETAFESSKIYTTVNGTEKQNFFRFRSLAKTEFLVLITTYFANYRQNASQNSNLTLSNYRHEIFSTYWELNIKHRILKFILGILV